MSIKKLSLIWVSVRSQKRCRNKRKSNFHISELNSVHYEHHSRFPLEQGMTHLSCPHLLPLPCMTLNKHLQKCLVTNRNSIHHTEDEWKEISIFLSFCVFFFQPPPPLFLALNLDIFAFWELSKKISWIRCLHLIGIHDTSLKIAVEDTEEVRTSDSVLTPWFLFTTFSSCSSGTLYPPDFWIVFHNLMLLSLLFWAPNHDF